MVLRLRSSAEIIGVRPTPREPQSHTWTFVVARDSDSSLATMRADGTNERKIVTGWRGITHPTWSPDGRRIAFSGEKDEGGRYVLCVVNADGSGLRILGDPRDVPSAGGPAWSPDGRRIAFTSFKGTDAAAVPNPAGIYMVNPDGSDWHRVTPVSDSPQESPAWSPDGTWIAYSKLSPNWKTDHISTIYRMKPDGTGARPLTKGGYWDGEPVISPDGEEIAFDRYRGTTVSPHIFRMSATGSAPRRVTSIEGSPRAWING